MGRSSKSKRGIRGWLPSLLIMVVFGSLIYVGSIGYMKIRRADDPVTESDAVQVDRAPPESMRDTLSSDADSLDLTDSLRVE